MNPNLANQMRYCADIGMFAIDRQISTSCVHKTKFCEDTCFNNKLFKVYPAMHGKDIKNEIAWADNNSGLFAIALKRKKKQTKRFRFMTRGEAFSNFGDVIRAENIIRETPNTIHWIPSRAWRNPVLFAYVQSVLSKYDNVRILASMDTSNTSKEWQHVKNLGLSTMFFGDDEMLTTPNGDRMFKCPKTWKHLAGHCAICKGGCFRTSKRVDVHLKQH